VFLLLAAIAVLVFIIPNSSFAQGKTAVISIADVEKLPLGTEVTIEGTVTVASGSFGSSFSDEGFQVQDRTGGMYIAIKTDLHLTVGQKVRLKGKLTETPLKFPIIESDQNEVHVVPGTARPKPISLATGKVGEPAIGRLIKISGTVTKPVDEVAPYGFRFSVDDGTGEIIAYVSTSTGISQKDLLVGQKVEMIGIGGKFNQRYQIYPRSPSDVKLIGKTGAAK
jgi:DNA/RNA endonuclease YhcR with UshA esterase domain